MLTTYKVQLDVFEGPLDLLLFLIRQEEVDIKDIPIASITKQYLEYIQLMRLLDLEIAGDFIVMASTLIRIKARMLLPQAPTEEGEEAGDPRTELAQNLMEYQEFKKLAETLDERQTTQRDIFYRFMPPEQIIGSDDDQMIEVSLFDLLAAFKEAMDAAPEEVVHEVIRQPITVEDRITFIIEYLQEKKRVQFFDMFPKGTAKLVLVVTFVALLELIKRQSVRIGQSQAFGDLWLYWHEGGEMPPETITPAEDEVLPTPTPLPALAPESEEMPDNDDEEQIDIAEQAGSFVPENDTPEQQADPSAITLTLGDHADEPVTANSQTGPITEPVQTENIVPEQFTSELTIMPASDEALSTPATPTTEDTQANQAPGEAAKPETDAPQTNPENH